jgi:hypothetical protein
MGIKIAKKAEPKVDEAFLKEYLTTQEEGKVIAAKISTMKEVIRSVVEKDGEVDEKGNKICNIGTIKAFLEARTTISLDQDTATAVLKKRKLYADCTDIAINESKVEKAFHEGKISDAEMATMVCKSTNYALKVKAVG